MIPLCEEKEEWIEAEPQNNWVNYNNEDGSFNTVGYCKSNKTVHLKGLIKGTDLNVPIITLPADCKPKKTAILLAPVSNGTASIYVEKSGVVTARKADTGSSTWLSLDGLSFPIN